MSYITIKQLQFLSKHFAKCILYLVVCLLLTAKTVEAAGFSLGFLLRLLLRKVQEHLREGGGVGWGSN